MTGNGPSTGRCRRCRRPLTAPESIAAGIGPVCATYPQVIDLAHYRGDDAMYDPFDPHLPGFASAVRCHLPTERADALGEALAARQLDPSRTEVEFTGGTAVLLGFNAQLDGEWHHFGEPVAGPVLSRQERALAS